MRADGLGAGGAAVVVGVAEVPLLKSDHLQRFAQLHQSGGQTRQAGHSGGGNKASKTTGVVFSGRLNAAAVLRHKQVWWSDTVRPALLPPTCA